MASDPHAVHTVCEKFASSKHVATNHNFEKLKAQILTKDPRAPHPWLSDVMRYYVERYTSKSTAMLQKTLHDFSHSATYVSDRQAFYDEMPFSKPLQGTFSNDPAGQALLLSHNYYYDVDDVADSTDRTHYTAIRRNLNLDEGYYELCQNSKPLQHIWKALYLPPPQRAQDTMNVALGSLQTDQNKVHENQQLLGLCLTRIYRAQTWPTQHKNELADQVRKTVVLLQREFTPLFQLLAQEMQPAFSWSAGRMHTTVRHFLQSMASSALYVLPKFIYYTVYNEDPSTADVIMADMTLDFAFCNPDIVFRRFPPRADLYHYIDLLVRCAFLFFSNRPYLLNDELNARLSPFLPMIYIAFIGMHFAMILFCRRMDLGPRYFPYPVVLLFLSWYVLNDHYSITTGHGLQNLLTHSLRDSLDAHSTASVSNDMFRTAFYYMNLGPKPGSVQNGLFLENPKQLFPLVKKIVGTPTAEQTDSLTRAQKKEVLRSILEFTYGFIMYKASQSYQNLSSTVPLRFVFKTLDKSWILRQYRKYAVFRGTYFVKINQVLGEGLDNPVHLEMSLDVFQKIEPLWTRIFQQIISPQLLNTDQRLVILAPISHIQMIKTFYKDLFSTALNMVNDNPESKMQTVLSWFNHIPTHNRHLLNRGETNSTLLFSMPDPSMWSHSSSLSQFHASVEEQAFHILLTANDAELATLTSAYHAMHKPSALHLDEALKFSLFSPTSTPKTGRQMIQYMLPAIMYATQPADNHHSSPTHTFLSWLLHAPLPDFPLFTRKDDGTDPSTRIQALRKNYALASLDIANKHMQNFLVHVHERVLREARLTAPQPHSSWPHPPELWMHKIETLRSFSPLFVLGQHQMNSHSLSLEFCTFLAKTMPMHTETIAREMLSVLQADSLPQILQKKPAEVSELWRNHLKHRGSPLDANQQEKGLNYPTPFLAAFQGVVSYPIQHRIMHLFQKPKHIIQEYYNVYPDIFPQFLLQYMSKQGILYNYLQVLKHDPPLQTQLQLAIDAEWQHLEVVMRMALDTLGISKHKIQEYLIYLYEHFCLYIVSGSNNPKVPLISGYQNTPFAEPVYTDFFGHDSSLKDIILQKHLTGISLSPFENVFRKDLLEISNVVFKLGLPPSS